MFHVCKLVHADLSEYNIMYHEEHLWIIDVSQSVEHDHPSAFDFLRKDIKNVEDFFGRLGVACLGLRRFFEFVTKEKLTEDNDITDEEVLKKLLAEKKEDDVEEAEDEAGDEKDGEALPKTQPEDAAHEDSVFLHSFIPRRLNEVYDPERDVEKHKKGDGLIYADTIGLVSPSDPYDSGPKIKQPGGGVDGNGDGRTGEDDGDAGSETEDDDGESGEDNSGFVEKKLRGHRHEDKNAKKVNKWFLQFVVGLFNCYCGIGT
jgi:RIO kinase 1